MTSGRSVHAIVERLLRTLNEKLSVEYALGYPVELTTVDECIVSYLTQLGESLDEMVRVASESDCGLSTLLAEPVRTNGKDSERFGKDSESSERLRLQLEQMASRLIELQRVEVEQKAQILKLESEKLGKVEGAVGVVEGVNVGVSVFVGVGVSVFVGVFVGVCVGVCLTSMIVYINLKMLDPVQIIILKTSD